MPPKRKASDEGDSSSSKVVDEFGKLLKEKEKIHGEQVQHLLSLHKPEQDRGRGQVVEAIFDFLKFEENDRVSCVVFLLTNAARTWWEATKVILNIQTLKWQEFKDLFFDKYFSKDVKTKKVKEFLELKHGSMNVNDYLLKFEEGCQFASYISKYDTEKGEHFLRGLRAEIKRVVRMSKATTYKEIVEKALMAEQDEKEIEIERKLRRQIFPPKGHGSSQGWKGGFKGKGKEENRAKTPMITPTPPAEDKPLCPKCGKHHKSERLVGSKKCFKCGSTRHIAVNCPQIYGKGKVQGRIFTMAKEGITPSYHDIQYSILLPSGDEIYPTSVRACSVKVNERTMFADLIVIPMVAFDVILGMDWLSIHLAVIDCVAKIVRFSIDGKEGGLIVSSGTSLVLPFISCMKARKMLWKGCLGFLASVLDVNKNVKVNLDDIEVVRDFSDVFADDVPRLPPDREVEFVIDVVPGTAPISKPLYRMAPTKMKELKDQLQELLDKGFIRPSFSPWGALVLFVKKKDALPLTTLTRKEVRYVWTKDFQQAFQILKDKLTSVPVLALPEGSEDFVVYTDASKQGLGAVLMQCGKVKIEHQRRAWLLQSLNFQWKWEYITMDFVVGLPSTHKGFNSIWVIVDCLTKSAHFLPVKMALSMNQYAESLHRALVSKLAFSTAYHPQSDEQSERVIQILEDLLRSCTIDFPSSWDSKLPLIEFTFNNSYHTTIGMAPYEALYSRKCRSPLYWDEIGERKLLGPELVQQTADIIEVIRERMKTVKSRQKSNADVRRRPLEFEVGDNVFIKITPPKGVTRFGKKGKLSRRYIGPFEILDRIGERAYRLTLPPNLNKVHNVFHVSMLRKYLSNPSHVQKYEPLDLMPNLTYEEIPIQILDRKVKVLRNKEIGLVKVLCRNHLIEEANWETEEKMKQRYPEFLRGKGNFGDKIF
ncbi:uncharacterized protein LOC142537666 [Primulina tabacum]|uniref:uncharacterized protein LOC142537666 n=1 Tax=Primulina tabacum TaxID=48773 RepID=UPI003F5A8355